MSWTTEVRWLRRTWRAARQAVRRHPVLYGLALLLFLELSLRVSRLPMRITWLPEIGGYDHWLGQRLYAMRSPVEYLPGVSFSLPEDLSFFRCNHRGCVGDEREADVRIVCLGGSSTWGQGVNDRDTYPAQLERMLDEGAGGRTHRVVNLGLSGSTSFWGARRGVDMAARFAPDAVILGYGGLNDSLRVHFREASYGYFSPALRALRSFQLFRLGEHAWFRFIRYPRPVARVTPDEYRTNCREMYDRFHAQGTQTIFLGEWSPRESDQAYGISLEDFEVLRREEEALAGRQGVPFVDPKRLFRDDPGSCFLADGVHWSKEGCRRVASACRAALRGRME